MVLQEAPRETSRPSGVGTRGRDGLVRQYLDEKRRIGDAGADAAKAATKLAPWVEHAEVKARRRLHEDRRRGRPRGHRPGDGTAVGVIVPRMRSSRNRMASCSRGPAVLSTITRSRAISS